MNKKGKKIKNNQYLSKLVNLRISGFSEVSLSLLFDIDRTALTYHFKKYGIENPKEVYDIPRMVSVLIPPQENIWVEIDGERINQGRSYQDYLKLSKINKSITTQSKIHNG